MIYHVEARSFILKLIRIQKGMRRKGYVRRDFSAVSSSIDELQRYLKYYKYDSDEKMKVFWRRKENQIRTLIPGQNYPGFEAIMSEFLTLKP